MANKRGELTEKQQNFCREYIKNGGNGTEAYLTAYNTKSTVCATNESCILLKDDRIQEYLKELRKPIEKAVVRKVLTEREKKRQLIQERIEACIAKEDDAAIARYLDIWNKLDGDYINITKDITDHNAQVIELNTDALKKLAAGN